MTFFFLYKGAVAYDWYSDAVPDGSIQKRKKKHSKMMRDYLESEKKREKKRKQEDELVSLLLELI